MPTCMTYDTCMLGHVMHMHGADMHDMRCTCMGMMPTCTGSACGTQACATGFLIPRHAQMMFDSRKHVSMSSSHYSCIASSTCIANLHLTRSRPRWRRFPSPSSPAVRTRPSGSRRAMELTLTSGAVSTFDLCWSRTLLFKSATKRTSTFPAQLPQCTARMGLGRSSLTYSRTSMGAMERTGGMRSNAIADQATTGRV